MKPEGPTWAQVGLPTSYLLVSPRQADAEVGSASRRKKVKDIECLITHALSAVYCAMCSRDSYM